MNFKSKKLTPEGQRKKSPGGSRPKPSEKHVQESAREGSSGQIFLTSELPAGAFQQLFEIMPDGLIITDSAGELQFVNRRAEEMFGYRADELIGKPVELLIPARFAHHFRFRQRFMARPEARPMGENLKLFALRKEGTEFPVEVALTPLESSHGFLVAAIVRDVTVRNLAEQTRQRSEIRSRSLLRAIPDLLIRVHRDGTIWDYKADETEGVPVTADSLLGKNLREIWPKDVCQQALDAIENVQKTGERRPFEFAMPVSDQVRYFEARVAPASEDEFVIVIRDITERKVAETALRDAETRYRSLVEQLPAITYIVKFGQDTNAVYVSPQIEYMLGFSAEEWLADPSLWEKQLHPEERESVLAEFALRDKFGQPVSMDYRILSRDGRVHWVHDQSKLILDDKGRPRYAHGVVFDITERRQAEAALEHSEKRFRALIENSADAISLVNAEGVVVYDSPAAPGLLGYEPDELVGHNVFDLIHPDDLPNVQPLFRQLTEMPGERVHGIFRIRRKNGTWRWIDAAGMNLLHEPAIEAIVVNYRDITERRQAEEELLISEDRYRDLVDNSQDLICTHDLDGRILSANPFSEQSLGYARGALVGINMRDILIPIEREQFDVYLSTINKNGIAEGIMLVQATSGETRIWKYRNTLRTEGVTLPIVRGIAHDITERRRAEEGLRASEERFRSVLDSMLEGFQIIGFDWKYLYVNDAVARQGHRTMDELVGHTIMEIYPGIEETAMFMALRNCMEKREAQSMENEFPYPDGSKAWFHLVIQPAPEGIFILSSDITERKRAELNLLRSEERFASAFHASPDAIVISQLPDDLILEVNDGWKALFGYEQAEVLNRTALDLNLIVNQQDRDEAVRRFKEQGFFRDFELDIRRKSGEVRRVSASAEKIDINGSTSMLTIVRDITERKRAEIALQQAEAKYRSIFEDAVMGIYQSTPGGQFITGNIALARMFGYDSPNELMTSMHDLNRQLYVDPERRKEFTRQFTAQDTLTNFTSEVYRKDGSHMWISENGRAVRAEDGSLLYYEGTIENITGRRLAETALLQSEQHFQTLFDDSPVSLWEENFSAVRQQIALLQGKGVTDFHEYLSSHPETVAEWIPLIRVIAVNKAAVELYGAQNKDDLLANLSKILGSQSLDLFKHEFIAMAEDQTQFSRDTSGTTLAGDSVHVRINWSVIPGHEEDYSRVIVSIIDLTERKRAEQEIRARTSELEMLYELSRDLASAGDLDRLLELVSQHAVESIHNTFARVALLEGDKFVTRAAYPIRLLNHDLLVGTRQPIHAMPVSMAALENNAPVIFRADDPQLDDDERAALFVGLAKTVCLVPLRIGGSAADAGQVLGCLMLGEVRNETREPFTPNKVRLAQSIGDQAAVAIRRILLHQQTERRLQNIAALREIDQAIASSFSMQFSLRTVLAQISEQLQVHASAVWVFDRASNSLQLSVARGFRSVTFESAKPLRPGEGYAGRVLLDRRPIHISNLAAQDDNPRLKRALEEDAFVSYHAEPLIAKGEVRGVLEVFHREKLEPDQDWFHFLETLAGQSAIAIDNSMLFEGLQRSNYELGMAYDATIEGWSAALDLRDKETEGHTQRVTEMTVRLAARMEIHESEQVQMRRGALLHDIGKMGVPDRILLKPDKLTDEEWDIMRKHPTYAYQMLKPIAYLRSALAIPYNHHEKWDGSGYPQGLKGPQIPLAARIFAVVDVYDALISDRPYRAGWSREKAIEYIREQSGIHFDPQVAQAFLQMLDEN